jgi:invasion protein IalB
VIIARVLTQRESKTVMTGWRNKIIGVAALLAALAFETASLFAQPAPAQTPAITDTHVTGSWVVRCYRVGNEACDLTQASFMRGKNIRVASIAIGFLPASNQYVGRFIVPLGVSFAEGLTIEIGSFQAAHIRYRRCERDGCYVESMLPQALLTAMQTPGLARGVMDIISVDGRKFQVPIALDGFTDGLALLKDWTVQKNSGEKKGAKG